MIFFERDVTPCSRFCGIIVIVIKYPRTPRTTTTNAIIIPLGKAFFENNKPSWNFDKKVWCDENLSNKEIRDISAVIYMENLKKLNLSNNNISNAQALISLTKLEDLDISGNRELDDISFIKFMTSLKNITYDE